MATLFWILLAPCRAEEAKADDWKFACTSGDVSVYYRLRAGSSIKEFKAVGKIDAPPKAVMAVLDDVDAYTSFMPYITECRVLKREPDSIVSYQRISPPFCTDRDYSLRVRHETKSSPAGPVYICRWELANSQGPAETDAIVRVKVNEGSWMVEPAGNSASKATYTIYTDSGGNLPAWLAAKGNQIGIGKLFDAVRKQVKLPKYNGK